MTKEVKSVKLEIHYGEEYAKKALLTSLTLGDEKKEEVMNAIDCMAKSRMALDRYKLYLTGGREYPYANETEDQNNIVELDEDRVNTSDVEVNSSFSDVKHLKFTMRGMNLITEKLINMRVQRMTIQNPKDQVMLVISIVKAIESFEEAYMRLGNVMRLIAQDNPSEYSRVETVASINEDSVSEEVEKTNAIMEERTHDVREQEAAEVTEIESNTEEPVIEIGSNDNNSSPGE